MKSIRGARAREPRWGDLAESAAPFRRAHARALPLHGNARGRAASPSGQAMHGKVERRPCPGQIDHL
ncbi:MAG TPA: hypothetical protein VHH88_07015 [Verrucomicrobiae bacterium]|nr:hypothetical protein [Verrucomicrobiae bacterium]